MAKLKNVSANELDELRDAMLDKESVYEHIWNRFNQILAAAQGGQNSSASYAIDRLSIIQSLAEGAIKDMNYAPALDTSGKKWTPDRDEYLRCFYECTSEWHMAVDLDVTKAAVRRRVATLKKRGQWVKRETTP